MRRIDTKLPGVFVIEYDQFEDKRGNFVKVFHSETFKRFGLCTRLEESFYSVSKKNVIRGMHFQLPPHEHSKLVYVSSGEILDVAVDLRKDSPTYGRVTSHVLSEANHSALYMCEGIAHGFLALSDHATVHYLTSRAYAASSDFGIRWDSIGFDWPAVEPIVSERDNGFVSLSDFQSPFQLKVE